MTIKHLLPPSKPTLDLNFAATRQLDPRITFTRASAGTYFDAEGILQTAADDEPRFDHDPATGESLGLLIEESRTNDIINSDAKTYQTGQPFTSAGGIWQSCSDPTQGIITNVTTTSEVGPDGLTGVTKIAPDAGISYESANFSARDGFQIGVIFTDTTKAVTGYFKPDGCDVLNVRWGNYSSSRRVYTLNSSTLAIDGSDATITAVGNGWFKFELTNFNRHSLTFGCSKSNGDPNNGTDGVLIWGVQIEDNATFPTSYIPTSGSTATRAADVASITGTNFSSWYNQSEGTMYAEVMSSSTDAETIISSLSSSDVEIADGFRVYSSQLYNRAVYYPISLNNDFISYSPLVGKNKLVISGSSSGSSAYFNGTSGSILASRAPQNFTVAGFKFGSAQSPNCHLSRISYYPRRLTDEQLEALTA